MKQILSSSTLGAQLFAAVTLLGSLLGIYIFGIGLQELLIVLSAYFIYGCLGIVVTFHRGLTHNSYKTNRFISRIFTLFGCFGGTGSPLAWIAIHINHHLKSDKPTDPHSPYYKGFKIFALDYAHDVDAHTKWRMKKLISDPFQQFLHRYYFGVLISWSVVLFLFGGFYAVIFMHWLPALVTAVMSNVVNYVGHKPNWYGSYRRYNLSDYSVNNWVWSIPSWGESWHNNHHRHPMSYRTGEKWYEIDISGMVIKLIKTS